MITLYSMPSSGNSYKVRLLLAQLNIPFRHVATEYENGKELTVQPDFRNKNPNGKVPLVEFEDGRVLAESNAILLHFAEGTPFLPTDAYTRALVYQWMFFEQNSHEGSIAVRSAITYRYPYRFHEATPERLESLLQSGNRALDVMESQLQKTPYLAGEAYTVADIALYAYTHSAEPGGFDIASRPGISNWLERVRNQPGHVPLEWTPDNASA
ncbi:MAG: glutathione S-transferase family protein [Pseudomonadota bacterium]